MMIFGLAFPDGLWYIEHLKMVLNSEEDAL